MVLVQVEAVCLVVHQKVAQGQVYSRHLVKHQLLALEHQQHLEEHPVCNIELLPSLHACVVIAQKWNCLHLYYAKKRQPYIIQESRFTLYFQHYYMYISQLVSTL